MTNDPEHESTAAPDVPIDGDRLWESVETLGEIGEQRDGSMMRVTGSNADAQARDLVVDWFESAGLKVTVDAVGNLFGRRPGRSDLEPVVCGSHIDTVPNGGKFDGTAGVLTALEVVRAWNDSGLETTRPVELVVFTEEEGTRFGTGLLGSQVAAGMLSEAEALALEDDRGETLGEVLDAIGYRGDAVRTLDDSLAFVELHVEQGPRLEETRNQIGVVDAITGLAQYDVTVRGESNHAGTTSMALRRDAFAAVAELSCSLEERATELARDSESVLTIGKVAVEPGGANVIPESVRFSIDLRDTDEAARRELIEYTLTEIDAVTDRRELQYECSELLDVEATEMDPEIVSTVATVCEHLDVDALQMPSGAGHDAMNVATVAPTAMIFVPSENGISHSRNEYTDPAELETGATVLERTLYRLAG